MEHYSYHFHKIGQLSTSYARKSGLCLESYRFAIFSRQPLSCTVRLLANLYGVKYKLAFNTEKQLIL